MANSRNKRLSRSQQKELSTVLLDLGVNQEDAHSLIKSDKRRILWERYKSRTDFSFSHLGQRISISFSKAKFRDLRELTNNASTNENINEVASEGSAIETKRKGRGKGKNPVKKVFSMALESDLLEELKEYALNEDRSVGSVVRLAIKKYLND